MNRLTRECDVCRREIPLTAVAVEARFLIVVDAPDGRHDEPMLRADVCSPGVLAHSSPSRHRACVGATGKAGRMRTEMIGVTHAAFMDLQRELERLRADNHAQACAVDVLVKDNKALVAENEALRCALSDALAEMQAAGLRPDTGSEGGDGVKTLRGFGIAFLLGGSMWAVAGGCVGRLAGWW